MHWVVCIDKTVVVIAAGAVACFGSLVQPGVVALEERLESDTHVLVLDLLAQLEAEPLDAVALKRRVNVLLLDGGEADGVVGVHFLALLPEVLSLLNDVASEQEDGLAVLDHEGTLVVGFVLWLKHDHLLAESLNLEGLNLAHSLLALGVADGIAIRLALGIIDGHAAGVLSLGHS